MIRDIVVYNHRILRLIAMGHGREINLYIGFKTVCTLMFNINCIRITGQRGIRYWNLNFAACRDAPREGEGKGDKREKQKTPLYFWMTSNISRCRE